jgi:tetratricopeptide (TPR) repeat protein
VKSELRIGRYSFGLSHFIFAVVFLLRLLVLARLSRSPFLLPSRGDMYFYNDWAQRILHGQTTEHVAFYGLPGYAYLLAFLYKIFGYNPFIPGLLQAGLDAGIAVLIYGLALRTCRAMSRLWKFAIQDQARGVGVVAALSWGLFVPAQAYSVILMPTVWFVFAFWLVVWRIVKNDGTPTRRECFWLGLLIGVTAMGIATILILFPLVLAALLLKPKIDRQRRWRTLLLGAGLLLGGVGLGTSPCWIRNYFIARDPVFLSAHSGINFWIGNNPTANGYPRFPPGLRAGQAAMLQDSITQAEAVAGHSLKRAEVSAYWSAQAKKYIAGHFADWLKLLALKLRNFWSSFQYDDLSIVTNLREQGVILPGLYFGVVAALAVPGLLLAWWLAPPARWIVGAILLSMFGLLPVFITERYRIVAVPGLLIFAAFGLLLLWQACVTNQLGVATAYLALVVGWTIFVAWPQKDPSLWALDAYNSGWQALESNNLPLAEKKLALAYAYVSGNSETNFALGNLRLAEDNVRDAQAFYRAVLAIDPQHKGALNNLGVVALEEKRWRDAQSFFLAALKQEPRNPKTHYLLARAQLKQGNIDRARAEIEVALQLKPNQPEFLALQTEISKGSNNGE